MKKRGIFVKIFVVILFLFTLVGCEISFPEFDFSNKKSIEDKINDEYLKLVSGESIKHTKWTFEAYVLDTSLVKMNSLNKYDLTMPVLLGETKIAIIEGFVNGLKPTNVSGITMGCKLTITGVIDEFATFDGDSSIKICFTFPEVKWDNMGSQGEVPDNGDNPDNGEEPGTGTNPDGGENPDDSGNSGSGTTPEPNPGTLPSTVNMVMINDTHGAFIDSIDGYSIARVDTLIDSLESQNGDYIKIANGDIFQGSHISSTLYGLPLLESLNLMDFDCFVLGNHEFDWGLDKIAAYKDGNPANGEANFPFLGANIYYKNTTTRPDWIDAYTIIDYQGVKVGIIGVIGGTQESSILGPNVREYTFLDDPTSLIEQYSKELRIEKDCDIVVVASHDYDDTLSFYNDIANFNNDSKVDTIFCAHTHQNITKSVKRADGIYIPVMQNWDKNATVSEVNIKINDKKSMVSYTYEKHYMDKDKYSMSSNLDILMNKYSTLIEEGQRILGTTSNGLTKSILGNYAATAMYNYNYSNSKYTNIDIALINTGGVRAPINYDDYGNVEKNYNITMSDVFNSFTFDNKVILVKIKGSYINSIVTYSGYYCYNSTTTIDKNKYYNVAVIDYVFYGDYWQRSYVPYATDIVYTDILVRDLVSNYIDNLY